MNFDELYGMNDEIEQISKLYEIFDEDSRLNRTKSARIEFYTTVKYIEKYLQPNNKILDIGAGAGEYSLYFADKGYEVTALELAQANINAFNKKIKAEHRITLNQGNAIDLTQYADNSFDIVLLFGPLYHLHNEADRQTCIAEAKRVCKDNGTIFFAFISNDMVIATEFMYDQNFFSKNEYNHETFKVNDFPFVFFTLEKCRNILHDGQVHIIKEVAADGLSELLANKINELDDYGYQQYLKYHFYCCEKKELLGYSNHLLFIARN